RRSRAAQPSGVRRHSVGGAVPLGRLRGALARRAAARRNRRARERGGGAMSETLRPSAEGPVERRGLPPVWLLVAKVVFSLGLFAFLFTRMPIEHVEATLRAADWGGLAAACSVLFASNVLGAWQWHHLLRAVDIKIPFIKVLLYYHVGL